MRGIELRKIFFDDTDRDNFVDRVGGVVAETKIGVPVPGKHAFDTNHHILKERKDDIEQRFGVGIQILMPPGFSLLVDDAHLQFPCMQIDAAIEFVLLIVNLMVASIFVSASLMIRVSIAYTTGNKGAGLFLGR